jgi:hypothetical protein
LKDIFAVQAELAATIVEQLRAQLTGSDAKAKPVIQEQVQMAEKGGTKNVEAHQHYLQGRFYANRFSEKGSNEAVAEYQKAVELDPRFALAWAGLAGAHLFLCGFGGELGRASFEAILPVRGRQLRDHSRLRPTCRRRCALARIFNLNMISIGKEQAIRCRRPFVWHPQTRRFSSRQPTWRRPKAMSHVQQPFTAMQ